jgi:high-affinity iron transporter
MEAVVFVGGVSLGQPAASIPIATIVGIVCGLIIGGLIYAFASRTSQQHLVTCRRIGC